MLEDERGERWYGDDMIPFHLSSPVTKEMPIKKEKNEG